MTMYRMVNGVEVALTPQEEAAVLADRAKAEQSRIETSGALLFRAQIERQADELEAAGDPIAAFMLLRKHGFLTE